MSSFTIQMPFYFTSVGNYLGMTLPIVTVVRMDENHSVISRDVTVAYFLPAEHQAQPPQPTDNEIVLEIWPATTVYTRSLEKKTLLLILFLN